MYMCVLKMVNEAHVKVISVDKQHIDFLRLPNHTNFIYLNLLSTTVVKKMHSPVLDCMLCDFEVSDLI